MGRRVLHGVLAAAMAVLGAGCHADLDDNWDGEIDCGSDGTYDLSVDLEYDGDNTFVGEGEHDSICTDGSYYYDCTIEFDVTVEAEKSSGEQDLDVELDDCVIVLGGDTYDTDCEDPENVEWDGKDEIVGEIFGCDFTLDR